MQDRYAFDVGDFGKCGLLRALGRSGLSVGVIWYAFPNEEHNADGKHLAYLDENPKNQREFRACDPNLYDCLRRAQNEGPRSIRRLESSGALPPGAVTCATRIETNARHEREAWFRQALDAVRACDLVFLDPDNGLTRPPSPQARTISPKHVTPTEVGAAWQAGHSLVIYHHIGRHGSTEEQIARWTERLQTLTPSADVFSILFRRGTRRAYFVMAQPVHAQRIRERIADFLVSEWRRHFEAVHAEWPEATTGGSEPPLAP